MNSDSKIEMRLGYVLFYVADPTQTAAFWCDAFGCTIGFAHDSQQYVELATGNTTLAFCSEKLIAMQGIAHRPSRAGESPPGANVSFVTASVDDAFERAVTRGAVVVKKLEKKPWGQVSGFVADPNGLLVEICTPVTHA